MFLHFFLAFGACRNVLRHAVCRVNGCATQSNAIHGLDRIAAHHAQVHVARRALFFVQLVEQGK